MEDQKNLPTQPSPKIALPAGKKHISTLAGTIIILVIAVLLFGGIYIYLSSNSKIGPGLPPDDFDWSIVTQPNTTNQTADWKTYNGVYPLSFSYPNTLELNEGDADYFSIIILKSSLNKDREQEFTFKLPRQSSTTQLIQDLQKNGFTKEKEFYIDGSLATQLKGPTTKVIVQNNNQVYEITDWRVDNNDDIFQKILDSIKFITPQNTVELSLWPEVNSFDLVNKTFMAKGVGNTANVIKRIKVYTNNFTKFYYVVQSGPYDGYHDLQWLYTTLKNWSGPEWWFTVKGTLQADSSILATEIYYQIQ